MSIPRLIDANANRAREALRVMEDAARFLIGDRALSETCKVLRHDITDALSPFDLVTHHRDTPGDVGASITTRSEMTRHSAADVVAAAGRRAAEALRAIEEYGKTIDAALAGRIETVRYRVYDVAQRIERALGSGRAKQWTVCVLVSEHLCAGRLWLDVARAALDGGADCIQLREKFLDDRELLGRARMLVEIAGEVPVIVNDRPDIALLAGAAGVHLGQHDLPCDDVRRLAGRQLIVGVSTACLAEAESALGAGADYCGVGPMFATTTKQKKILAGPGWLRDYLAWNRLPHLAIGGITPANVGELAAIGCHGVAVSSAVCGVEDPAAVVRALREALAGTPRPAHVELPSAR